MCWQDAAVCAQKLVLLLAGGKRSLRIRLCTDWVNNELVTFYPKGAKSALGRRRNSRLSLGAELPDSCCLRGQVKAGE